MDTNDYALAKTELSEKAQIDALKEFTYKAEKQNAMHCLSYIL